MKGMVALCLSICLHAYASVEINETQSLGLKMIEAAKSAAENFVNNKKSIGTLLDIFKDNDIPEDDTKPKPNVVVDSPEGKIELTIDLTHKELNEYVDNDYTMKHFRSAVFDIKERLIPIANMEAYYAVNNQRAHDEDDDYPAEFNKKTYWLTNEMYHSQDPIKRNIVVLETNLAHLKDPDFRMCDFYFKGHYRATENKIYKSTDESLQEFKKEYLLERSEIMWNVADARKFIEALTSNFNGLFNSHHKILLIYNTKSNNRQSLKSIDDDIVEHLEAIFRLRVKIAENLQLILREIDAFEGHKDAFQKIFDDAERKIENIQLQEKVKEDQGINAEQYFKTKEKQVKDDSMQLKIEEELAEGTITMEHITDADMADRIITKPLLKSPPQQSSFIGLPLGLI